jgi:hypothetical protein
MSKFTEKIAATNSATLMSRSEDLEEEIVLELSSFINNLKKEKSQLKSKINKLTDLAPENTTSLRPGHADFEASEWVKNLHKYRMDLALKDIELKEAEAIHEEFFGDEETK